MGDSSKRLKQTYIVSKQTLAVVEAAATDLEELLPNVDIYAKIYAYCEVTTAIIAADAYAQYAPAVHGRPVYVGQTIQELKDRDRQHSRTSHSALL
eukprot:4156801-Prymnesium_polylepis.1